MAEEEVARISVAVRCRPLSEHDAGSAGMGRDGKGWEGGLKSWWVVGFLFETEKHQETAIPWYIGK